MDNGIFRKKSLERVTSPEGLNEYLRVAGASVWLVLIAIIVLLAGVCVWGIFGKITTKITTAGIVNGGVMYVIIDENKIDSVNCDIAVNCEGKEYKIVEISKNPEELTEDTNNLALHITGLETGDWVYVAVTENTNLPDGVYEAYMITESISPMEFVLN